MKFRIISAVIIVSAVFLQTVAPSFAGAVGGPKKFDDWLKPGESAMHSITFKANEQATISVASDEFFAVTLYEEDGSVAYSEDADIGDGGFEIEIENTPSATATVRVEVTSKAVYDCVYLDGTKGKQCEFLVATN